jgi:hypothetical protein
MSSNVRTAVASPYRLFPSLAILITYVVKSKSYFTVNEKISGSSPDVAARLCSLIGKALLLLPVPVSIENKFIIGDKK